MLAAIILVGILAVSAVSANELNATEDTVSEEMAVDDTAVFENETDDVLTESSNVYVDIASTSEIEDGSLENPYKSVYAAYKASDEGTTINIAPGIYSGYDNLFNPDKRNLVFKAMGENVVFDGSGHMDVNFMGKSYFAPIFKVHSSGIVFDGITFINGHAEGDGGALYFELNNCAVRNCKFINCSSDTKGGAIYVYNNEWGSDSFGCNMTIQNCEFTGNKASNGGAIYWDGNKGYLSNCTFTDNNAKSGGAVTMSSFQDVVAGCIFKNNTASGSGGAIYWDKEGASGVLFDSMFIDNTATWGGAIYWLAEDYGFLDNSTFINNSADTQAGAVFWRANHGYINNSVFTDNSAHSWDGAVTLAGDEASLLNCVFSGNTVEKYGAGAVNICGNNTVCNVTFTDNAASEGGAVYVDEDNATITNCIFTNNRAKDGSGGAIKWDNNNGNLSYSTFKNNTATDKGGAIYWSGNDGAITFCTSYTKDTSRGNDLYIEGTNVVLTEYPVKINVGDVSKYYGGSEELIVEVTKDDVALSNADVRITLNGKTSAVKTDSNGHASIPLDLDVGNYDVVSECEGIETTSKVTVASTVIVNDVTGSYLNSKISATFLNTDGKSLSSKEVTFKANGKVYSAAADANGFATVNVDLGVGNYTVTAVNPVNNEQKQFKLVVSKANSQIALTSAQNRGAVTLTAILTPAVASGNVIFTVGSKTLSAPIKDGKAALTLNNLAPGNYTASASYGGDINLNPSVSDNVSFTVLEVYPVLTADDVIKTYGDDTNLAVNLMDSKGNAIANANVNVNITNQITPLTTDADGHAFMPIDLVPGTYDAAVTYKDTMDTAKITVDKATPEITAKNAKFKAKTKTKKLKMTLKSNGKPLNGVKVTLKVNGKKYKATVKKGKATFKITKLTKKGKYKATISCKGNAYYNAKSVKVKITVK